MLRHRYAINDTDSSARGSLFREICGEKRGWHLKPRYFPISSVLKTKMNFGNLKGRTKILEILKESNKGSNALKKQNGKSSMETTQNIACPEVIQLCHLVID